MTQPDRAATRGRAGAEARPLSLNAPLWTVLALVVVGLNLRPALTTLAPVLAEIRAETGLSSTLAGVLTTLPVLCLGLFGLAAPRLARRFGPELTVLLFLNVLAFGTLMRGFGLPGLFSGMILAGAGIGVVGVLLPGLIKRDFPDRPGLMMGVYTMVLCAGAAAGTGLTVPAEGLLGSGWQGALMVWALPALVAAAIWAPLARRGAGAGASPAPSAMGAMLRDPLAWAVTLYMGLQSSLAYIAFGWLPVILRERGLDALQAGWVSAGSIFAQVVTALVVPVLAARARDQRPHIAAVIVLALSGFAATVLGPLPLLGLSAAVLGLGLGGCFGVALTLIVLRARDAQGAADLSGLVQSVGYAIAAAGPVLVGAARDASGGWTAPVLATTALGTAALAAGMRAGRAGYVLDQAPQAVATGALMSRAEERP